MRKIHSIERCSFKIVAYNQHDNFQRWLSRILYGAVVSVYTDLFKIE